MRRRRILLLLLCSIVLLAGGGYLVLVLTDAPRLLMTSVLGRFIRSDFGMRGAEVDPTTGTVRLADVHISHPDLADTDVLRAGQIELDVNTNPLGSEQVGSLRQVRIEQLDLSISLSGAEQWSLWQVLEIPAGEAEPANPAAYPAVTIVDSRIALRITQDRPAVEFTAVELQLLPETEGSSRMVLSGSMLSPSGFVVRLRGSGDLAEGNFHALVETDNVPLEPRLAQPYSEEAERYLADAGLAGMARKVALWIQYPAEPGDDASDITARLTADVEGVDWTLREFPYPIIDATGQITASTRNGGRVTCDLHARVDGKDVHTDAELTELLSGAPLVKLRLRAPEIPVDERLEQAITPLANAGNVWRAFEPAGGVVNAEVSVYNDEPGGQVKLSLDLRPKGVSARFAGFPPHDGGRVVGFPYAVDEVEGLIQIRFGKVAIRNVTARRADGASVRVNGLLTEMTDRGPGNITLDIDASSVTLSDEIRSALDVVVENGGEIYDTYEPTGVGDVSVRLRKTSAEPRPRVFVEILPRGGSARFKQFPYLMENLSGSIAINNLGVVLDLSGSHGDGEVDLGGRFLLQPADEGLQSELWIEARSIPLDPELRAAVHTVNQDLDWFWSEYQPTGTVDCQLSLWQPAGGSDEKPIQHDIFIQCSEASLFVERFGRHLENLTGDIFVHGLGPVNHVDISVLRGEIANADDAPPARVIVEGRLVADQGNAQLDLSSILRGLALDSLLARSLDQAGLVSQATWDVLDPAGLVDMDIAHDKAFGETEIASELSVHLRDVACRSAVLPMPATELRGEVRIVDERGDFSEITGMLGTSPVQCRSGFFEHRDGRSRVQVLLAAQQLPIDQRFANLMIGPLRRAYIERGVLGQLDIPELEMTYSFPDNGDDFELTFRGPVRAQNLSMSLVAPLQGINGIFEFVEGRVTPDGGNIACVARDVSFHTLGHQVVDLNGRLEATPSAITLDDLEMTLHGGRVTAGNSDGRAMTYDLQNEDFSAIVNWNEMSLTEFLLASGHSYPVPRGTVSGAIDLRMPRSSNVDMEADASIRIRNGRLGEVPMFTAIYAFLAPSKRPQFDGAQIDLRLRHQRVEIDRLALESPLVEVNGKGSVDFDGYLDFVMEFPDFFAAGDWLILPQVLGAITSRVVRFHVFGYLRSPKALPRWLFQERPRKRGIDPIPAPVPPATPRRF